MNKIKGEVNSETGGAVLLVISDCRSGAGVTVSKDTGSTLA